MDSCHQGDVVLVLPGIYSVSSSIFLPDSITIEGKEPRRSSDGWAVVRHQLAPPQAHSSPVLWSCSGVVNRTKLADDSVIMTGQSQGAVMPDHVHWCYRWFLHLKGSKTKEMINWNTDGLQIIQTCRYCVNCGCWLTDVTVKNALRMSVDKHFIIYKNVF